jgi:hypothetical protein
MTNHEYRGPGLPTAIGTLGFDGIEAITEGIAIHELSPEQRRVLIFALDQMDNGGMTPVLRARLMKSIGVSTIGVPESVNRLSDPELLNWMFMKVRLKDAVGEVRARLEARLNALLEIERDPK